MVWEFEAVEVSWSLSVSVRMLAEPSPQNEFFIAQETQIEHVMRLVNLLYTTHGCFFSHDSLNTPLCDEVFFVACFSWRSPFDAAGVWEKEGKRLN